MARKSRRNNNIIEKKQEMMTPEIITGPQLETGVYARLSVEKDNEETIQTQIEMLHQYVEEHGEYHLVDTYVDNGYTGTDFDRPGFIRMMEDVRTGKIQCIIVKDLSRLGRDYIETGNLVERVFPMMNIRFVAITDNYDSSKKDADLMVAVTNIANDLYAKDISKKISSSKQEAMEKGIPTGNVAYGYKVVFNENKVKVMVEDKEAADVVRLSLIHI